jgi:hypothetical protein
MSFHRRFITITTAVAAASLSLHTASAQLHERKQAQIEQSAQATNVPGGITFQSASAYEKCFEGIANFLKRDGHELEIANKEAGSIVTAMEITGKYTQTGMRVHVTLIKDSDTQTSIRVAVTIQKRKKLLSTEPWSEPKVDTAQSTKIAADLELALKKF